MVEALEDKVNAGTAEVVEAVVVVRSLLLKSRGLLQISATATSSRNIFIATMNREELYRSVKCCL